MIMNVEKKNQTNKFLVLLFFSSSSYEKNTDSFITVLNLRWFSLGLLQCFDEFFFKDFLQKLTAPKMHQNFQQKTLGKKLVKTLRRSQAELFQVQNSDGFIFSLTFCINVRHLRM